MRVLRDRLAAAAAVRALALGVGLSALLLTGCGPSGDSEAGGEVLRAPRVEAPDFSYPDLDGNVVRLSDLRGKTVVIDFWATWCPPCIFQPEQLNAFYDAHRNGGKVMVLGVEVGGATPDEVRAWAEENDAEARYPVLTGADEDLARRYGAVGFPATVVVAPDGRIESMHVGIVDAKALEATVAPLLAGRS